MAPNLFLCAKTAVTPWTWCSPPHTTKSHFYSGKEPVEGVYAISPNGKRYLVAVKSNHNKDIDGIFQIPNSTSNSKRRTSANAKVTQIESPTLSLQTSRKNDHSAKVNIIESTNRRVLKAFLTTTAGATNHRKSSFDQAAPHYARQTATQSITTQINEIKLDADYRFLFKPLRIEYNNILSRWMFSSEIRGRSIVAPMCKSLTCMENDVRVCGKIVKRELFCLDDGVSWVVGNTRRKMRYRDGEFLYVVDEKTGVIRRQSVQEVRDSRMVLWKRAGRILKFEEDQDYSPLLKYLDLVY
ncbi:uncharacterized protein RSE6_00719 [Rhynchosporium secalis]|uniref:Uncharacterized protein n=1 Tax=Rhynchosporium secalis TaxID=38038 RepID=A0A1E1LVY6_RHYSE|nr:uncharacterized protein RSE6_00719 [Rhynchosporium secalis]